MREQAHLERKI